MDSLKNKKILVFGTGAVGGYYGGMLVKADYDVIFVARGKNYEVLKEKGLTLISNGKKEILLINAVKAIHELPQRFDYILVCTKSKDTRAVAETIKPIVNENTCVVSLQNGVENEDILCEVLGKEKVIGGLVFVAAKMIEPGVVDQFGYNGGIIGELDCKKTSRVLELQKILVDAGIDCKISDDIRAELWNKLVWNAAFNPLSVLTGKTIDKILEDPKLYELTKNIMTEVRDVAFALGLKIRSDTVEFNLGRSKGFTGFKTSMLQDFERGRPIEIEELVGVVIRKAKEKNINVPNIKSVYEQVKQKSSVNP